MGPHLDLDRLDFAKGGGLVTVVTQEVTTGRVLMVAHADREALERTLATGEMHYRSRTRGLWRKGETSGNRQRVRSLSADCDGDAVLALVHPAGPACHGGGETCFGDGVAPDALSRLDAVIGERIGRTASDGPGPASYTVVLAGDRNTRLKKIGEEAAELVLACADERPDRAMEEAADLLYHALVAVRVAGGTWAGVRAVLSRRLGDGV